MRFLEGFLNTVLLIRKSISVKFAISAFLAVLLWFTSTPPFSLFSDKAPIATLFLHCYQIKKISCPKLFCYFRTAFSFLNGPKSWTWTCLVAGKEIIRVKPQKTKNIQHKEQKMKGIKSFRRCRRIQQQIHDI